MVGPIAIANAAAILGRRPAVGQRAVRKKTPLIGEKRSPRWGRGKRTTRSGAPIMREYGYTNVASSRRPLPAAVQTGPQILSYS